MSRICGLTLVLPLYPIRYHVDEKAPEFKQRGYPQKPGWPKDHYMVAVQQADGKYELEQSLNFGDPGDFWTKGNVFGPNSDGDTWPNSDTYQNGIVKPTGIKITVLSDAGFIMFFKVEGLPEGGAIDGSGLVPVDPLSIVEDTPSVQSPAFFVQADDDPDTAGSSLAWILSVLGGMAALLGLVVFFFVI